MAQTIVSRAIDPIEHAVLSITSIHGGEAYNVIPNKVEIASAFETFSETVAEQIETELRRICAGVAAAHGITVTVTCPTRSCPILPPSITPQRPRSRLRDARRGGRSERQRRSDPAMGSEDFSFMLRLAPGAYVLIGNGGARRCIIPPMTSTTPRSARRRLLGRARAAGSAEIRGLNP